MSAHTPKSRRRQQQKKLRIPRRPSRRSTPISRRPLSETSTLLQLSRRSLRKENNPA